MRALDNKIVVYDGSCRLCLMLYRLSTASGLLDKAKCVAFQNIDGDLHDLVDGDRFMNEMAVVDTTGKPTIYGLDAIILALSDKISVLKLLSKVKWVMHILWVGYRILAQNRFLLLPAKVVNGMKCSCEPPFSFAYRLAYILLNLILIIGILGLIHRPFLIPFLIVAACQLFVSLIFLKTEAALDYTAGILTLFSGVSIIMLPLTSFSCIPEVCILNGAIGTLFFAFQYTRRAKNVWPARHWPLHVMLIAILVVLVYYRHLIMSF